MEHLINSALMNSFGSNDAALEEIRISVVGVGGGGNNTINRLSRLGVSGADLIACNTDRQHLSMLDEGISKMLIGKNVTKGLGAGGFPEVGAKCAEVDREMICKALAGSQLVFLCAGMGGGTGTGAIPVFAEVAKEQGAIVVAMISYPFSLERARVKKADDGISRLLEFADSVIVLDNNRLVEIVPNLPMNQAFLVADEILAKAIGGLVFTIKQPSLVNIDFADVRAIMGSGELGMIAVGSGKGNSKVEDSVESVLKNRLLDVDFAGASGAIIHIAGGADLTLGDAIKAGELITEQMSPNANVKWGARLVPEYDGRLEVCAIVTGVKSPHITGRKMSQALVHREPGHDIEILG